MGLAGFAVDASHLLFGAFATFCAILLWSRTREMAWIFIIVAVIISYAAIVLGTLRRYGILGPEAEMGPGIPIVRILLADLPLLFSGIGLVIAFAHKRTR